MSFSTDLTDKKLKTLENRIAREYKRAYNDMNRQWRQYIKGYDTTVNGKKVHHKGLKERYAEQYQAYLDGAYTKEQFDAWYLAQVQRGEKYKKMRDDLADRMTKANEVAAAYINDATPGIYSLNANYSAWQIEKANPGVDFTLVNEQTVKVLMTKSANVTEFRTVSVNPIRDYDWNSTQIQSALTSGILTGKSIDHLADAFLTVMQRNRTAAVRNARTAVTSAQNAGTLNTMLAAEAKGIKMMKRWYSMEDSRVRASHAKLNGQLRGIKEKFSNGLMYPGDSSGPPREVYNCRCTMEYVFPQFQNLDNNQDYQDWVEKKAEEAKQIQIGKLVQAIEEQKIKIDDLAQQLTAKNMTFTGIWANPTTLADWGSKSASGSFQKKIDWFQDKLDQSLAIGDNVTAADFQKKIDQVYEYDQKGKEYAQLMAEKAAADKELKELKAQARALSGYDPKDDPFSEERKNAALWAKSPREADKVLRAHTGEVWQAASMDERESAYKYTYTYHPFNEPLRGWEYGISNYSTGAGYKGVGNTDLNRGGCGKNINDLTALINKCSYDQDIWLQRGVDYGGTDKFLGIDMHTLQYGTTEDLQKLVGNTCTEYGFMSCGDAKGKGFDHKPIILNIYAPEGTKMMYLEPFSQFGKGTKSPYWDGIQAQATFGDEAEVLLQQGTMLEIKKIERTGGKIYIDLDVIGLEDPQIWHK